MMIKKVRHIGIIVEKFDQAVKKFEVFGMKYTEVIERKEDGLKIAFFPIGDTLIEFLYFQPDKALDPLHTILRPQKGPLNHLCFEVDNLEAAVREFEKNGAKLIEGSPRSGAHGRIAFFHPETTEGVLIEICEV
jgi:methylmalonyl-CoA/ethylmalonyl-CoA epimerase